MDTATSPTTTATAAHPRRGAHLTAAVAGLVWLAAAFGSFTPEAPDAATATADLVRAYAADSQAALGINALSSIVSAVALLALTAALGQIVERASHPTASRFVGAVGAVAAVQLLLFAGLYSVWVLADASRMSDEAVLALHHITPIGAATHAFVLPVTLSMVAVVSWLALRARFLSRPVALLGLAIAAAEGVSMASVVISSPVTDTAMYVAIFGWLLWPVLVAADLAIKLARRRVD
ncbi:hypothetical protein GCM10025789_17410 [Tessaracoccus lubricantis]|uniref:DUF4386 domain-containing protein n=1 Tax=Tessaracoccus lubricantis TaxID=545543 RepID=A0ABP9FG80_9ACTN